MIERIQLQIPSRYDGMEELATDEMKPFAIEVVRRLNNNIQSIYTDLTNQVVVDTDLLPRLQNGQADPGTTTVQTNIDVEQSIILGMMLSL